MLLEPLRSYDLRQLPQVGNGCLSDRKYFIIEPVQTDLPQLLREEALAKLAGQNREFLDNCETSAPVLVGR